MDLTELELTEEQVSKITEFMNVKVQSETDKVRTEYSKQIKELEKFKPTEKSDAEIELESLKAELKQNKFEKSLAKIGASENLAKYLKNDIDIEEFKTVIDSFSMSKQKQEDYVANKHANNVGITKEQFSKMGIADRTKLYTENPTVYAELTK